MHRHTRHLLAAAVVVRPVLQRRRRFFAQVASKDPRGGRRGPCATQHERLNPLWFARQLHRQRATAGCNDLPHKAVPSSRPCRDPFAVSRRWPRGRYLGRRLTRSDPFIFTLAKHHGRAQRLPQVATHRTISSRIMPRAWTSVPMPTPFLLVLCPWPSTAR
jgi:hypothetical protein